MKRLLLVLLGCLLVLPMAFGGTVLALDEEAPLPDPGTLPDSPFYFLDKWGENIGLAFAFGPEAKAEKAIQYAGEKLAEAQMMATQNKPEEVGKAAKNYDDLMAKVDEKVAEAKAKGVSGDISEKVAIATARHLTALDEVADRAPEAAQEAVTKAKESSVKGLGNALRVLAEDKPEKAAEISVNATEKRLNRAKSKADENEIEDVEEAVDEANELIKYGTEISEIARGLGKDTTTVDQLIAKASEVHLEVLQQVYEKVPEQAKAAIERAMTNSVNGYQRAAEALAGKDIPGGVPSPADILDKIPEAARERIKVTPGKPSS